MLMNRKYYKSIFFVFAVWAVILLIHSTWAVFTSEHRQSLVGESFVIFLTMFYSMLVIVFALGGLLAWQAQKGKVWALWLFTLYCLYHAVDSIWTVKFRHNMEGISVDAIDWVRGIVFALVWGGLIVYAWNRHSNKLIQPTAESDT